MLFSSIWRGVAGESRYTPLKERALQHLPFQLLKGVSRFKLPLGRCRGTAGVSLSYTITCRVTMGHLDPHLVFTEFASSHKHVTSTAWTSPEGALSGTHVL